MNLELEKRTKIGVAWSTLTQGMCQVFSFGLGVILARVLVPEDFGVFAAILIFNEVASSIVSSGIVTALIQRKDVQESHYSTALMMQIVLGILACFTLAAVSSWVGDFFHNPLAGRVLRVMSLYLLILPFIAIPTAMLRKQINFRSTGIAEITQQLAGGLLSVALALGGWGVWSLVYGRLIGNALMAFHLAYLARWRPRFHFARQAQRDLFSFGAKVVLVNILNDLASNVDYLLVGRFLGPAQLGFYSRAYYLMTLPVTRITAVMNNVLFSAFAAVQEDEAALKNGLLKAICYISLITFPLLTGLFWVAPAFIHVIYGDKWMASVLPLQIMCFAGMLFSVEPVAVSAITARGFIGLEVRRQFFYLLVLLAGVFIGSYWGILGVSFAVVAASLIFMVMLQQLLDRLLRVSWRELLAILAPSIFACQGMCVVLISFREIARKYFPVDSVAMLLGSVLLGSLWYLAYFLFFRWGKSHPVAREALEEIKAYRKKGYEIFIRSGKRFFLCLSQNKIWPQIL